MAYLGFACTFVVAVGMLGTFSTSDGGLGKCNLPGPGLPRSKIGTENVIVIRLRGPPKPITFVLDEYLGMPKGPRIDLFTIDYFCTLDRWPKFKAIVLVLLHVLWIAVVRTLLSVHAVKGWIYK